jgi:hypothetical protein
VLQIFKNYSPYAVMMLFIATILLKLGVILHPEPIFVASQSQIIWQKIADFLHSILGGSSFLITFFAVLNLFGQSIFLNKIANDHHLFPKSTYLPAITYLMVTSLFKEWNYLSGALINNWLVLAILSGVLKLYATEDARKHIFNIGCFISLSSFIIFPSFLYIILLLIALAVLRPFKVSEWMVGLLGLLTPYYFLVGILYLTDSLPLLQKVLAIDFSLTKPTSNIEVIATAAVFFVIILVIGTFYLNYYMDRMLFQYKKWWWVTLCCFIISIVIGMFTLAKSYNQWMMILPVASLMIANTWFEERKNWFKLVCFYLFIAIIIFTQWY